MSFSRSRKPGRQARHTVIAAGLAVLALLVVFVLVPVLAVV